MGLLQNLISRFKREKVDLSSSFSEFLYVPPKPKPVRDRSIAGIANRPQEGTTSRTVKSTGVSYFSVNSNSRQWLVPQVDHLEIETLTTVESYFARANRVKLGLFLREGSEFVGPNDEKVEYIRTRIKQIEKASGIPLEILLFQTCRDLIVHSNAYWLKVRKPAASGGKIRTVNGKQIKPVAGYFPLPPETMVPEIDRSGNITRWKQVICDKERIYSVDDIVHFYAYKTAGYPLGIPSILSSIDDIRALRNIETNVDILIHKHLFPIVLWKVGTPERPAEMYSDGSTEIEVVQDAVAAMPAEGSLVVPERFDVNVIGVENKALRIESYLKHFVERLLAGLDVSSIDVGIGSASSRSTAQTLSRNVMDIVKFYQTIIEALSQSAIDELLLESTFTSDTILDPENRVRLSFHEIDKEAKKADENHITDLFLKNMVTYDEAREGMGREPLTPEEEKGLWWYKFGQEEALIGSVDELSGEGAKDPNAAVANKNQPANQHGTRSSAKINKDSLSSFSGSNPDINPLLRQHLAVADEVQKQWAFEGVINQNLVESDIRLAYETATRELKIMFHRVARKNYADPDSIHFLYTSIDQSVERWVNRLRRNLVSRLKSSADSPSLQFDAVRYRTVLIYETELARITNLAKFRWFKNNQLDMEVVCNEDACEICKSKLTEIRWNDKLGEVKIPPHHPLCSCGIKLLEGE